jgi:hypothetical protein
VARVAHVTFVVIGLAFLLEYAMDYTTGFDGPVFNTIGSVLYVVIVLGLPFMAVFTLAWMVVEFVRRFRRCRATRPA